jgi:hypothetical protein
MFCCLAGSTSCFEGSATSHQMTQHHNPNNQNYKQLVTQVITTTIVMMMMMAMSINPLRVLFQSTMGIFLNKVRGSLKLLNLTYGLYTLTNKAVILNACHIVRKCLAKE